MRFTGQRMNIAAGVRSDKEICSEGKSSEAFGNPRLVFIDFS